MGSDSSVNRLITGTQCRRMCSAFGVNAWGNGSLNTTSSSNQGVFGASFNCSSPQRVTNMNFSRKVKYSNSN
ncbi:hypothetical protein D3C75_1095640 [compost metagenome]